MRRFPHVPITPCNWHKGEIPEGIDPEVLPLCRAINRVPGLETFESCCGHGKSPFHLWFEADRVKDLFVVARALDIRYGARADDQGGIWSCKVDEIDLLETGAVVFLISSGPMIGPEAYAEADAIARRIEELLARGWVNAHAVLELTRLKCG